MAGTATLGHTQGKSLLYVPDRFGNIFSDIDLSNNSQISSATVTSPFEVAATPNGKFAYVGGTGGVSGFKIDSNGTATAIATSTPSGSISGMVVDSSSHYLYVSNTTARELEMFSIDGTTGVLTQIAPAITFPVDYVIRGLAADSSTHVYLAVQNTVALPATTGYTLAYQIGATGALTQIGSPSPTGTANGSGPLRLAIGGSVLFGTVPFDGQIAMYLIQPGGGLSALGAANVITVNGGTSRPTGIAVRGSAMVVTDSLNATNNVRSYSFTQAATYSLVSTASATSTFSLSGVTIDPSSPVAYVAVSGGVARFSLDPSTALMSTAPTSTIPLAAGANPQFIVIQAAPVTGGGGPTGVPAASTWALALLGMLLAASSVVLYRRSVRQS